MIETDITDATVEDTDPGPERGGGIEVDPETGQISRIGNGASQEKEEGADIKMETEMGRETEGIGNAVGVEGNIDRDEVGARNQTTTGTWKADQCYRRTPITPLPLTLTLSTKRPHLHTHPNTHTTPIY